MEPSTKRQRLLHREETWEHGWEPGPEREGEELQEEPAAPQVPLLPVSPLSEPPHPPRVEVAREEHRYYTTAALPDNDAPLLREHKGGPSASSHAGEGQERLSWRPRRHPWRRHEADEACGTPLDASPTYKSRKVVLLFDCNGTLTTHSDLRRGAGIQKARPGVHHLHRLKELFHLGLYSSSAKRTTLEALALVERAAGPGAGLLFDRKLLLNRSNTALASAAHLVSGGNEWDTVKPLRPFFSRLHRILLVDDDSYKACPGEEGNLLHMPRWQGDDQADVAVSHLVKVLLGVAEQLGEDSEADVRPLTASASAHLLALTQQGGIRGDQRAEQLADGS